MMPTGNLISTLYDARSAVKCLALGMNNIFYAGTEKGLLMTYNLEKLKKNVPTIIH